MSKDNGQTATPDPSSSTPPLADTSNDWLDSDLNGDGNDDNGSLNDSGLTGSVDGQSLDDDPIVSLSYLQKFGASSNASERQNAVRNVVKTLQSVEQDEAAVAVVFNMVTKTFAEDGDAVVRGELLEQLPMICMHCSQTPNLQRYIKESLLPLLVRFLNDQNTQVRKTCQAAILILIEQGLMVSDDITELIYPELMKLSGPCFPDDVRIEAVCLLCKLVSTLGRETTISLFLNKFTELCQDSLFHIRKTCASHLGEMSRVLGQDVTEKLLVPHLISLSQDSVWGVRKTCAECFTDISYNCAMQTRRHQLAPVFIVLLADNSRWVQCSAFQALGPFISTFADSDRTGLKWVEGELVYSEPRITESIQHSGNFFPNPSLLPNQSRLKASSTAGDDDDDDADMNLGSLLDDSGPSSAAITSNIAQLAKQRLNGDINSDPAPCIVDLSASILPPVEGGELEGADSDNQLGNRAVIDSTKTEPNDIDFTSFKYWQLSYFDIDDVELLSSGVESVSLENPKSRNEVSVDAGDTDSSYRKFMERHLGVGAGGAASVHAEGTIEKAEEKRSDVPAESKDDKEDLATKERSGTEEHTAAKVHPHQQRQSGSTSTDEYISFIAHGHHGPGDSPDPPAKGFEYQDIIPQALLDQFLSMVEPSRAQSIESDISRHCAFNLPAVAFTIGRRHWPLIKPTYLALANDMQWKVRRTLAFSIHELAAILGPDLTVQDLLPVFSGFLRDLDEVRIGILRHLYDFLKLLNKDVRRSLLPSLADFLQTDNYRSWRFRHLFAEQLIQLCDLFDIEDINDYLSPIAMTLAIDKISEIRHVTHRLLATILRCFYKVEAARSDMCDITDSFIQDIVKGFAKSQRWVRRQTFVYVCREVVRLFAVPESKFAADLLPALLSLAHDNIPNVRIVLAALFAEMYYMSTAYLTDAELVKEVGQVIKALANDRDRDVRLNASCGGDGDQGQDVIYDDQTGEGKEVKFA